LTRPIRSNRSGLKVSARPRISASRRDESRGADHIAASLGALHDSQFCLTDACRAGPGKEGPKASTPHDQTGRRDAQGPAGPEPRSVGSWAGAVRALGDHALVVFGQIGCASWVDDLIGKGSSDPRLD
jgi:hypothetical protein